MILQQGILFLGAVSYTGQYVSLTVPPTSQPFSTVNTTFDLRSLKPNASYAVIVQATGDDGLLTEGTTQFVTGKINFNAIAFKLIESCIALHFLFSQE